MTTDLTTSSNANPEEVYTEPGHGMVAKTELISQLLANGALQTGRYVMIPAKIERTRTTKTLDASCVPTVDIVPSKDNMPDSLRDVLMEQVDAHYGTIANAIISGLIFDTARLIPGCADEGHVWSVLKRVLGDKLDGNEVAHRKIICDLMEDYQAAVSKSAANVKGWTSIDRKTERAQAELVKKVKDEESNLHTHKLYTYGEILKIGKDQLGYPTTWTVARFEKVMEQQTAQMVLFEDICKDSLSGQENLIQLFENIRSGLMLVSKFVNRFSNHRKIDVLPVKQYIREMYKKVSSAITADYQGVVKMYDAQHSMVPRDDISFELAESIFREVVSGWNADDDAPCHIDISCTAYRTDGVTIRCELVGLNGFEPVCQDVSYSYESEKRTFVLHAEDDVIQSLLGILEFHGTAHVLSHHLQDEPITEDVTNASDYGFTELPEGPKAVPYSIVHAHLMVTPIYAPVPMPRNGNEKPILDKIAGLIGESSKYAHLDSRSRRMVRSATRPRYTQDDTKPNVGKREFNPALHIPVYQTRPGIIPTGASRNMWNWNSDPSDDDGNSISIGLQFFTKLADRTELIVRNIIDWEAVVDGRIDKILRLYNPLFGNHNCPVTTVSNLKRLLSLEVLEFAMTNSPYDPESKFHRRNKAPQLYAVFRDVDVNVAVRSSEDRRMLDEMKQGKFSQCLVAVENKELWPWISGSKLEWLSGTLTNEDLLTLRHVIGKQNSYAWGQTIDAIILRAFHALRTIANQVSSSKTIVRRNVRYSRSSFGDVVCKMTETHTKHLKSEDLIQALDLSMFKIPVFTVSQRNLSKLMWEDPGFVVGSINRKKAIELSKIA